MTALRLTGTQRVYVRSMRKVFRVTAIAVGGEDAAAYLKTHMSTEMIVAQIGPLSIFAETYSGIRADTDDAAAIEQGAFL